MAGSLINLLRVRQWYKNSLIFLPIFFSVNLLNLSMLWTIILGFFVFFFISSSFYILNDIHDVDSDRKHPEKRHRPIASGKISLKSAQLLAVICFLLAIFFSLLISFKFLLFPMSLFILSTLYTFVFKRFPIVDLHFIAVNYIIRALAGVYAISVPSSPWLILFVFLVALFLAVAKRKGDAKVQGQSIYNAKFLEWASIVILGAMLFSYILYTFMAFESYKMMLTIPIASFLIFKYLYFVSIDHPISRKAELMFTNKPMLLGLLAWLLVSFLAMYL